MMIHFFRKQPPAFGMIFMLEIWERFGYYTVQGILTLYFIRFLGFNDEHAYYTFGAFSALVYGITPLGGYLGDHILGTKRTIVLGLALLALGYLSLAFATKQTVFAALALICVGNGIFKPNPSNLLSQCYKKNDPRLFSGFTLYYMAINLGSIFALFMGPWLSNRWGYPYAYGLSFMGIILGLSNYWFQQHHIASIHTVADKHKIRVSHRAVLFILLLTLVSLVTFFLQHVHLARQLIWAVALITLLRYSLKGYREGRQVAKRMLLALILMVEAIVFFTLYQQMPTSLNLFAIHNVHPYLLGIAIDPQSLQVLNPIWIILLSPLLAMFYTTLEHRGIAFPTPYKFALGMTCCGLSFTLLYFARFAHDDLGMVSSWWLIASYLLQSLGELLVSALGVAMVAELVPSAMTGFVMGMWFLTSSIASFIGASVASYTALPETIQPGLPSLLIYTQVFAYIGLLTLSIALLLWIFSPFLNRLMGIYFDDKSNNKDL